MSSSLADYCSRINKPHSWRGNNNLTILPVVFRTKHDVGDIQGIVERVLQMFLLVERGTLLGSFKKGSIALLIVCAF
jgi:hypothetical protein